MAVCVSGVGAQSVVVSPQALSRIPKGATRANPYWQRLAIELSQNPSAGNAIRVGLPVGMGIADLDGDGAYDDEIALDDAAVGGTGYTSTQGSTRNQIVLTSAAGGTAGTLYVQFPVVTPSSPDFSGAIYGQMTFTNAKEQSIPAGAVGIQYVEPYELSIGQFSSLFTQAANDTLTHAQGSAYPDSAQPAFTTALPDLLSDQRGSSSSNALVLAGVPYGDLDDANDTRYHFWFSPVDSLSGIDTTVAVRAVDRLTGQPVTAGEGEHVAVAFDVSSLQDTTTYYLYATSDLTGQFPLMRSRGIRVRHLPVVLEVGSFFGGDADYVDTGRLLSIDKGLVGSFDAARDRIDIPFQVIDHDDSASVKLFFATADTLDTTFVVTSGTSPDLSIDSLTHATQIDSATALFEGRDTQLHWQVALSDSVFVPRGDYYVYAVITDGKHIDMRRSAYTYNVRHSPLLILDSREDRRIETGGPSAERYYTISWNRDYGVDGDVAIADDALIALYYSDEDSFAVPGGVDQLRAAAADSTRDTHLIVDGIAEGPDKRTDNQYVWDLWRYKHAEGGVPQAGVPYALYGIVRTDSTARAVRWDDERGQARHIEFSHSPYLRVLSPFEPIEVDGRRSFSVTWDAIDVDEDARIWVVLTSATAALSLGDSTDYQTLVGDGQVDWLATSTNGSLASAEALSEDAVGEFAVRPARLTHALDGAQKALSNGEYYAYVLIAGADSEAIPDGALARRATGRVRIVGLEETGAVGLEAPALEMVPGDLTLSVPADTATIALRPHSGGVDVDLLSFFASVDSSFFRIVDQDTAQEGIQPFRINPLLSGLVLRDTLLVGTDSLSAGKYLLDLIYFDQGDTDQFNGDMTLATIQVVSRDTSGVSEIAVDHLGNRQSAFFRDGQVVSLLPPDTAVRIRTLPRGSVSGRIFLQGRQQAPGMATLLLRDRNSFVPIDDSLFVAANDLDSTRAGIQDSLSIDGRYELREVPTGEYQLAVHIDGYLDGYFPLLRVYPGQEQSEIDPMYPAGGVESMGYLLGGDVTGYVDTDGESIPDNEIDQLDVDFVVSYFGQTVSAEHAGRLADIDGDSLVWISDLNIVAANFNRRGVEPVYKVVAPNGAAAQWSTASTEREGRLHVDVMARDLVAARAVALRLLFDEATWQLDRFELPLFSGRPAVVATQATFGQIALGAALSGAQQGVSGEGAVARVVLRRVGAGDAQIQLRDAEWVDAALVRHRTMPERALPIDFALLPNVPNPFNPETQLRFALPAAADARLDIYDGLGQRVRSLVGGPREAGVYVVTWDGRDDAGYAVASGAYFAHLHSAGRSAVRKMLLLR